MNTKTKQEVIDAVQAIVNEENIDLTDCIFRAGLSTEETQWALANLSADIKVVDLCDELGE